MSDLANAVKGRVLARADAEYEATRQALVWNGLKIAVRSGGHHFSGTVVRDGGMLLDMSAFDHCEIDVQGRTARVGPERSQRAFAPPVWERLAELRAKHDPTGVFHAYFGSEASRDAR